MDYFLALVNIGLSSLEGGKWDGFPGPMKTNSPYVCLLSIMECWAWAPSLKYIGALPEDKTTMRKKYS
jgi:hypothetical protein